MTHRRCINCDNLYDVDVCIKCQDGDLYELDSICGSCEYAGLEEFCDNCPRG